MVSISPQISEASAGYANAEAGQNGGRVEGAGFARKGGAHGGGGVFAKLLAGLRKNLSSAGAGAAGNAVSGERPDARAAFSGTAGAPDGTKEPKETKQTLRAAIQRSETARKRGKAELAAPSPEPSAGKGRTAEKAGTAAGREELFLDRLLPQNRAFTETGTDGRSGADTFAGPDRGDEPGIGPVEGEKARKSGREAAVKAGVPAPALAHEAPRFSPVPGGRPAEKAPEFRAEDPRRNKRKEKVVVEVHDLRTAEAGEIRETVFGPGGGRFSGQEISLELRPSGEKGFPDGWNGPGTTVPGNEERSFESLLARQLSNGELSSNIVRQAAIVLRDGGEGTIRLALRPETLGKVKIHLEMAENKVSGRIVVESEEALRAFQREIHSLEQAFRDSGFAGASLDTALDSGNGNQRESGEDRPFFSGRLAVSGYEAGSAREGAAVYADGGFSAVNMLV